MATLREMKIADLNDHGAWHVLGFMLERIESNGSASQGDVNEALDSLISSREPGEYMNARACRRNVGAYAAHPDKA
ncbi:hypothetical protein GCM10025778_17950 [Paeniglutamicibacter antarcticus]|uniref:Uncharacterized protein n=1 Tax=Paeniglutamicibacter antarcticus TaxID=494023 RepID=A0ABP9TNH8_9MICC